MLHFTNDPEAISYYLISPIILLCNHAVTIILRYRYQLYLTTIGIPTNKIFYFNRITSKQECDYDSKGNGCFLIYPYSWFWNI